MSCPCEQRISTTAAAQSSQFARHTDCSARSPAALLYNICFLHLYKSGQVAGGVSALARIRWLTREFGDAVAACGHAERRCGHAADGDEDGASRRAMRGRVQRRSGGVFAKMHRPVGGWRAVLCKMLSHLSLASRFRSNVPDQSFHSLHKYPSFHLIRSLSKQYDAKAST
jgi:hypothetical protein